MPRMPKRKKCTACDDDDCKPINCDECKFCLDMPKNGGPGKKKKACKFKRCLNQNIQPLLVNVEVPLAVSDGDVHQVSPVAVQVQDSEDEAADANVVLGNVHVPEDQVSPVPVQDIPNAEPVVPVQNDQDTYEDDFNPNAEPVEVQDSEDEAADANVVLEELNAQLYVRPLHSSSRAETSYSARSLFDESTESFEEETFLIIFMIPVNKMFQLNKKISLTKLPVAISNRLLLL